MGNLNAQITFSSHTITTSADGASSVFSADMDNDGDMDAIAAAFASDLILWYENDGSQNFTPQQVSGNIDGVVMARPVDMDGDGDMDVISAAFNAGAIYYHENDGSQNFTTYQIASVGAGRSVDTIDMDNDGDIDVISGDATGVVNWHENDGNMGFTTHVIAFGLGNLRSARAGDLDGDGDNDVAIASYGNNTVSWYQNDGAENFGSAQIITSNAAGAITLFIIDLDADGDNDVLSASELDDKIVWYENDGSGNFTAHTITTDADGARWVYAKDIDQDNDVDVLSASRYDDKIAWYENDGAQNFTTHVIATNTDWGSSVFADDMDNDGDIDVLSASTTDNKIAWYENDNESTVLNRSVDVDGTTRTYLLYVPAAYTGQEPWPLVINYHGFSSNATNQMNIHSKMNAVADTGHFLIAYPEGLMVEDLVFGGTDTGWNVEGAYSASHNDIAFTDSMINHISADYNVDYGRVHATGYSNGSEMVMYLACEMETRIASIAGVSGTMNLTLLNNCFVSRPFSMMLMHGTADPLYPFTGVPNQIPEAPLIPSLFAEFVNYCTAEPTVSEFPDIEPGDSSTVTLFEYVDCYNDLEVRFYQVNNGGHTWPGTAQLPAILGNENHDINASSEIWNFFKRNPHPTGVPQGEIISRNVMLDGVNRTYELYVPAAYDGQEDWPLVLNFHGHGSSPQLQMLTHSKMNTIADTAHFLVAYPQGFSVFIPGIGSGNGWNVPGFISVSDDVDFADSLIQDIRNDYSIDASRIHATGWSNGCTFAFYLAMQRPEVFASVGGVSGPLTIEMENTFTPIRPMSTLLMHGTEDPIVPFGGTSLFRPAATTPSFWAAQNNCLSDSVVTELTDVVFSDSSNVTRIEYINCDNDAEVLFYRINNGGHPWPGSAPSFNPSFAGYTNRDITGSSEIWNFFKRNPHPDLITAINDGVSDLQPEAFTLYDNYPNPFNPSTLIRYALSQASPVELTIFNVLGQSVRTLVSENMPAGEHTAVWDGRNDSGVALSSGTYFYRLTAGDFSAVKKMLFVK